MKRWIPGEIHIPQTGLINLLALMLTLALVLQVISTVGFWLGPVCHDCLASDEVHHYTVTVIETFGLIILAFGFFMVFLLLLANCCCNDQSVDDSRVVYVVSQGRAKLTIVTVGFGAGICIMIGVIIYKASSDYDTADWPFILAIFSSLLSLASGAAAIGLRKIEPTSALTNIDRQFSSSTHIVRY